MSKPPFKMPTRTDAPAAIDQWVSGGGAIATAEPPAAAKAERPAGKLARLTIDLPPELHAKFKATCALRKTRMIDEVRRFIGDWTQKHG